MNSKTSLVAKQCRLQQWAMQIKDCQNRPAGMKVRDWCNQNGITKADYYYRMRRVREACLDTMEQHDIVSLTSVPNRIKEIPTQPPELILSIGNATIHVNQNTSVSLLKTVIKALQDVE